MEFLLLTESSDTEKLWRPHLIVENHRWSLTEPLNPYADDTPEFQAISYAWDQSKDSNPIYPSMPMSTHTLSSLTAALHYSNSSAFWINAFSVPPDPVARSATLESLAYIYGRAKSVIVVLSPASFSAIEHMCNLDDKSDAVSEDVLETLNQDLWVHSVWTYQELANASELVFISEDPSSHNSIPALDLLNALGYYVQRYKTEHNFSSLDVRRKYPHVDLFEDLILGFALSGSTERSALDIMSGLVRTTCEDPRNYYYSMIGAKAGVPSERTSQPSIETLSGDFMRICEEKGDYSFIFASNPRDERLGLTWRPQHDVLRPVIAWQTSGGRLMGTRTDEGVTLKDIVVKRRALSMSPAGKAALLASLQSFRGKPATEDNDNVVREFYDIVKELGFSGYGDPVLVDSGVFFPQEDILFAHDIDLWIASTITYTFGSPALSVLEQGGMMRYVPGVYVGIPARDDSMSKTDVFLPFNHLPSLHSSSSFLYSAIAVCFATLGALYLWSSNGRFRAPW